MCVSLIRVVINQKVSRCTHRTFVGLDLFRQWQLWRLDQTLSGNPQLLI